MQTVQLADQRYTRFADVTEMNVKRSELGACDSIDAAYLARSKGVMMEAKHPKAMRVDEDGREEIHQCIIGRDGQYLHVDFVDPSWNVVFPIGPCLLRDTSRQTHELGLQSQRNDSEQDWLDHVLKNISLFETVGVETSRRTLHARLTVTRPSRHRVLSPSVGTIAKIFDQTSSGRPVVEPAPTMRNIAYVRFTQREGR
jgi:hypothetical protein